METLSGTSSVNSQRGFDGEDCLQHHRQGTNSAVFGTRLSAANMPLVEVGRIGDIEVAHQIFEVRARRSDDKMKMVGHQDEGEQADLISISRERARSSRNFFLIEISEEDLLSSVAPARHVIAGVFILDAQGASHSRMIAGARDKVKDKQAVEKPTVHVGLISPHIMRSPLLLEDSDEEKQEKQAADRQWLPHRLCLFPWPFP